jgi:hypothetical protein
MKESNNQEIWRDLCSEYYKSALSPGANLSKIKDHRVILWFDTNRDDDIKIEVSSNVSASAIRLVSDIRTCSNDSLAAYRSSKAEARRTAHMWASRERKAATLRLVREMSAATRAGAEMQKLVEYCRCVDKDASLLSTTRGLVAWIRAMVGQKEITVCFKVRHIETLSERPQEVQKVFLGLLSSLGATCVETGRETEEESNGGLVFAATALCVSDDSLRRLAKYASRRVSRCCGAKFDFSTPSPAHDAAFVMGSPVSRGRTNQGGEKDDFSKFVDNRLHALCPIL